MKNVFEIAYRYVVPAVKRVLVLELISRGFTEVEVSRTLKISKSLTTRYVKGERGSIIDFHENPFIREVIRGLADKVVAGGLGKYELEAEVVKVAASLMSSGRVCEYHGKLDPEITRFRCNLCSTIFSV